MKARGQCTYSRAGKDSAKSDYDGQHHWLELDNNPNDDFFEKLEKEKVVWAETIKIYSSGPRNYPRFCFDIYGEYLDKTTFFMTGGNLRYLLGILNSRLSEYLLDIAYSNNLGGGSRGLQKNILESFPIPEVSEDNKVIVLKVEDLVNEILSLKQKNLKAEIKKIEDEIDQLVYQLYGLTDEEIKIVEDNAK